MNIAKRVNGFSVIESGTLPKENRQLTADRYFLTSCIDFDHYQALPDVAEFMGETYVKTGWNSDKYIAHYKTNVPYAKAK